MSLCSDWVHSSRCLRLGYAVVARLLGERMVQLARGLCAPQYGSVIQPHNNTSLSDLQDNPPRAQQHRSRSLNCVLLALRPHIKASLAPSWLLRAANWSIDVPKSRTERRTLPSTCPSRPSSKTSLSPGTRPTAISPYAWQLSPYLSRRRSCLRCRTAASPSRTSRMPPTRRFAQLT